MVKFAIGNMWQEKADIYLATTNSVINTEGELVMGAGSAKSLKNLYPGCDRYFGHLIYKYSQYCYGLIIDEMRGIGAFQTKTSWRDRSTIELIQFSTNKLIEYCAEYLTITIFLPYPGVENGGLSKDVVRPIVQQLPDTVTIWSLN